jgi:hypothetical protein
MKGGMVTAGAGLVHTAPMLKRLTSLVLAMMVSNAAAGDGGAGTGLLIDDFAGGDAISRLGTRWRVVTDQVMGGVSDAAMTLRQIDGRSALCLSGDVSLANNGGFVQVNLDLSPTGLMDASRFDGVRLIVRGNSEVYNLHLKTAATTMPWQSYRAELRAGPSWQEVQLPFDAFQPHRLVPALDVTRLRRLGIVAIGRAMQADICVAEVGFY